MIIFRVSMLRIADNLKALLVILEINGRIIAGQSCRQSTLRSIVAHIRSTGGHECVMWLFVYPEHVMLVVFRS